ncbi:hypothetical protein [Nocardioides sp. HB32]
MANKSPINKLQDTVVGTVKAVMTHPVGTAGKAVGQARGAVLLGRTVAEQVGKTAVGAVAGRLGHGGTQQDTQHATQQAPAPVRSVTPTPPVKKAPPAKKADRTTPTRPPVTDVVTDLVKEQAAHQPVPAATAEPVTSIDATADVEHVDATPADVAKKVARKAPATRAPAKKTAAKKTPGRKTTPSAKLPTRKAAPKSAAEVVEDADLPSPIESIGSSTDPGQG